MSKSSDVPALPAISVALCTYNGARFLPQQLASLAAQTYPPCEVVVCDDGSTDGTPELLRSFAGNAPFPVHIHFNDANLGSTKNFEQAIGFCTGDIIATCDQDDVWLPHKLQRFAEEFATQPEAGLLFSDARLIDDASRETGHSLWDCYHFPPRLQKRYSTNLDPSLLVRFNVVTGACMAFRRSLVPRILPVPREWIHDAWIAFVASVESTVVPIPEPLIRYRRHAQQQVGANPITLLRQMRNATSFTERFFLDRAKCWQLLREHLGSGPFDEMIAGKIDHSLASASMRGRNRFIRIGMAMGELTRGCYHRYGLGLKSFLVDAFYP